MSETTAAPSQHESSRILANRLVYLGRAVLFVGIIGALWSGLALGEAFPLGEAEYEFQEQFNWILFFVVSVGGALLSLIPFSMLIFASHVLIRLEEIRDTVMPD